MNLLISFFSANRTPETLYKNYSMILPRTEIDIIIAHHLNEPLEWLLLNADTSIPHIQFCYIDHDLKKRKSGIPIAHIVKQKEFYGHNFYINNHVLVPRPESELIVSMAADDIQSSHQDSLILDIGTGSGCIILSLEKELSHLKDYTVIASDISIKALSVAKRNAISHQSSVTFFHSNMLHNTELQQVITETSADIYITANLPYVDIALRDDLITQPESRSLEKEPFIALWSDRHGLSHYARLFQEIKNLPLHNNSNSTVTVYCEINPNQSEQLSKIIYQIHPTAAISAHTDLSNRNRVVKVVLKKRNNKE